jgi:hypothetical protein
MSKHIFCLGVVLFLFVGCSGMKVINSNVENKGTKMLDFSDGTPKIVSTYSCNMRSSGQTISAIGKTEKEARAETLAKCRDKSIISFCKEDQISCIKN